MILLVFIAIALAFVLFSIIRSDKPNKNDKNKVSYDVKLAILQRQIASMDGSYQRGHSNHTYRGGSKNHTRNRIDMRDFTDIISFDPKKKTIEVEANIKVCDVIDFLLKRGHNLTSCPDLPELCIAGLVCGVGGGNTSFSNGYFHNQVVECDVIHPNGLVTTVSADDELFKCIPFTLGTMGYITRLVLKVKRSKPFVASYNYKYDNAKDFYKAISEVDDNFDFCDATIYSNKEFVLVLSKYVSSVPANETLANVVNRDVYYEEIRTKRVLFFRTYEFVYRFASDLYYTSMELPSLFKNKTLRSLIPKSAVDSVHSVIGTFMPVNVENICQDVLIPVEHAYEFFIWYDENISLYPLYNVPVKSKVQTSNFWPDTVHYIDFGVGYGVLPKKKDPISLCRAIEIKMLQIGGKARKLPYTDTHIDEKVFWNKIFGKKNKKKYDQMRAKYGCAHFPTVYDKIRSRSLIKY